MNVYVESNFVLELALLPEEHASCEEILNLCDGKRAQLVVPAFALVEPYVTLTRRQKKRTKIKGKLDTELRQIARSADQKDRLRGFQDLTALLINVVDEETKRLKEVHFRLTEAAQIVPLDASILAAAIRYQGADRLSAQDAVIYSTVLSHLQATEPAQSCFLSRNSKDFSDQDIVDELRGFNCKYLPRFKTGYQFILHSIDYVFGHDTIGDRAPVLGAIGSIAQQRLAGASSLPASAVASTSCPRLGSGFTRTLGMNSLRLQAPDLCV